LKNFGEIFSLDTIPKIKHLHLRPVGEDFCEYFLYCIIFGTTLPKILRTILAKQNIGCGKNGQPNRVGIRDASQRAEPLENQPKLFEYVYQSERPRQALDYCSLALAYTTAPEVLYLT
jgi:hypothetical protein